ncbi:MAG: hypothetical protein V2I76_01880 [Roseobacter sp.]|jgi:hypothetical protein|nr:hypothetical protein [Roseobacter sp.]
MTKQNALVRMVYSAADIPRGQDRTYVPHRGSSTLRAAAKLIENTAYSEAGNQPTAIVSQLIMVSADLERLAQAMERQSAVD